MSGRLWLIVEGQYDGDIVRAILSKHPDYHELAKRVEVIKPTGGTPNLSRLAAQLEKLIRSIQKQKNDCIAVLHDQDANAEPHRRQHYDKIQQVCRRHPQVVEVIAKDELEAWLLADGGLCDWLGIKVQNWEGKTKPSEKLASLINEKFRLAYPGDLSKILPHLDGTGFITSKSLRAALEHLEAAPCVPKKKED